MLAKSGSLYIVATPIGNLGDLTTRAVSILREVDEVWAEDTRHSGKLFQHLGLSPKTTSCHDHNESERVELLLSILANGKSVALIADAGTPLISDPGYRLVSACRHRGFSVVPIPGASAVIAALSVSGLATDRFVFEGFPPAKAVARNEYFKSLGSETRTLVFYESSHRIKACLLAMAEVFGGERLVVVARELTKLHETVESGSLKELSENFANGISTSKGEFVVVLAGAGKIEQHIDGELARVLGLLLTEMSPKRAASIAASITGASRNQAYRMAQALKHES